MCGYKRSIALANSEAKCKSRSRETHACTATKRPATIARKPSRAAHIYTIVFILAQSTTAAATPSPRSPDAFVSTNVNQVKHDVPAVDARYFSYFAARQSPLCFWFDAMRSRAPATARDMYSVQVCVYTWLAGYVYTWHAHAFSVAISQMPRANE